MTNIQKLSTTKGKSMIFHDGYAYTLERSTDIKLIFWCQKRDCKGRCHTNLATDLFLTPPTVHSHAPNPDHLPFCPTVTWNSTGITFANESIVGQRPLAIFVNTNNTVYVANQEENEIVMWEEVVKTWLNDPVMTSIIVAGTGIKGSNSNQLSYPRGIFVDVSLDLYVADCDNHRVQLFQLGNSNGITVAGSQSPNPTISLSCPTGIVLDDEKYLFIVDSFNDRIVGSGVNGFRCLIGCYGGGSQSNELSVPFTLSFDRSGNMFVTDQLNHRIQQFQLLENSCVWNRNGITFANQMALGSKHLTIFINGKNSVYTINKEKKQILIWHEGNIDPAVIIPSDFYNPSSLFVTSNDDIYIDNGEKNGRVEKWISNTSTWVTVLFAYSLGKGLFIDTMDNLYCSMSNHHHVAKRYLHDHIMILAVVTGTGDKGSASTELNHPHGIFVDEKFDLYVADCGNNRVQCFRSRKSHSITVAGDKSFSSTIPLNCPTGITFDAEKYLFIVDSNNHRILRLGPSGFRFVVECREGVFQFTQLSSPFSLSFDRFGNMFVTDTGNNRIQKFQYLKNSCGKLKMENVYNKRCKLCR
ncbi:unnamed protein product [Didymodactylos carnosus]|uniref:FLYWCH-type domain-containing protein n=1 Tax=Didymodactylos carnosus TaxID=1234261 RepID=A0A814WSE1_9BILA|nr:unnamed protein product [Didymodactylos carnosus]CAF3970460.1 unnamed protein product [Didymodactylos carnosus]